jgi:hypothetical protein
LEILLLTFQSSLKILTLKLVSCELGSEFSLARLELCEEGVVDQRVAI